MVSDDIEVAASNQGYIDHVVVTVHELLDGSLNEDNKVALAEVVAMLCERPTDEDTYLAIADFYQNLMDFTHGILARRTARHTNVMPLFTKHE